MLRKFFLRDCESYANIEISCQIGCFNRKLLSLSKEEFFDGGGAHPLTSQEGLTVALDCGRTYGFQDLFQGGYKSSIRELVDKRSYRELDLGSEQEFVLRQDSFTLFTRHRLVHPVELSYSRFRGMINPRGPIPLVAYGF